MLSVLDKKWVSVLVKKGYTISVFVTFLVIIVLCQNTSQDQVNVNEGLEAVITQALKFSYSHTHTKRRITLQNDALYIALYP